MITSKQIREILKNEWPDLKYVWLFSSMYDTVNRAGLLKLVEPIQQKFNKNKFDCDKFVMTLHALVACKVAESDLFAYDLAFGQIMIKHSISKKIHAVNLLVQDDGIALYEPQGNIFINGENFEPFYVRM